MAKGHQSTSAASSDELISPAEAAELLGIHLVSVYRMLSQGRLTRYRRGVGRRVFIRKSDVVALGEAKPEP